MASILHERAILLVILLCASLTENIRAPKDRELRAPWVCLFTFVLELMIDGSPTVDCPSLLSQAITHRQGLRAVGGTPGYAILGGCDKALRVWNYLRPEECWIFGSTNVLSY